MPSLVRQRACACARRVADSHEGSYDEWRFQLVAYLTAVDPRFGDVADDVARRTTPYLLSDLPPDDGK